MVFNKKMFYLGNSLKDLLMKNLTLGLPTKTFSKINLVYLGEDVKPLNLTQVVGNAIQH